MSDCRHIDFATVACHGRAFGKVTTDKTKEKCIPVTQPSVSEYKRDLDDQRSSAANKSSSCGGGVETHSDRVFSLSLSPNVFRQSSRVLLRAISKRDLDETFRFRERRPPRRSRSCRGRALCTREHVNDDDESRCSRSTRSRAF